MKLTLRMLFPASLFFLFSFSSPQHLPASASMNDTVQTDSTAREWIDDFKVFRDAVYHSDQEKVKTFFSFPVLNPSNEIWWLVLSDREREAKKLTGEIAPFTEKDFSKYYKKIFPPAFTSTLLKIKSAELFNKGETESVEIKKGNTTYKMYASVDKETHVLSLNLSYTTVWKDDKGEVTDGGESSVIYSFSILPDQHLKFMYVRLAG